MEKLKTIIEANKGFCEYSEEDIHKAFMAGVNRGVFVASVIVNQAIDGEYPTCEEYIAKIKNERSG
jgi:hypothetical protein